MTLIPFDDRDGYIWMDGKMIPWRDARLHVLSHGLHYGGSVFEGERMYEGRVFKLEEHSERLIRSAALLDFAITFTAAEIAEATKEVAAANGMTEAYMRPLAWRGPEVMGVSGLLARTRVAIACWQWPKYFAGEGEDRGIRLLTSSWRRPHPQTMPVQSKACGLYMIGTMAKQAAERAGYDDALMLDYKGRVAEATGANIFLIRDGVIRTPAPECFLNGITRQTVIALARDLGYTVLEEDIMPEDLPSFAEIFVTGTAAEITAIGGIDDRIYPVGPVTRRLRQAYADLVRA
jgi:branched-chain amino acid aminotransferase